MASWVSVGVTLTEAADGTLMATHEAGAAEALVRALAAGAEAPEPFVVRTWSAVPAVTGARGITADQTNESVVVGERLVVKWLLRPERRAHPAPPVLAHLASVGFTATARPYATVSVDLGDVEVLLALVVEYLPDAVDGWEWCVDTVLAGDAGGFPSELGRLTGRLHVAFATPSEVFPAPRREAPAAEIEGWAARAAAAVDEAVTLTAADAAAADAGVPGGDLIANSGRYADPAIGLATDQAWLRANASRVRDAVAVLSDVTAPTPLQPIHGDLHVGQILRWRDGYAIVDFDGNPTVDASGAPEPVARDVAQMLTSLDHVGRIADRRTAGTRHEAIETWIRDARAAFLAAYRAELAAHDLADALDDRLLAAFEVEQECRELLYAARFLPRWRYAPMAMLRTMFPAATPTTGGTASLPETGTP